MMRRYIACMAVYMLLLFSTTLHAGGQDCPVILPPQYGGTINMWGTNYQPCTYKEWFITLPDDAQYALLEYQIDINTSGVIDYVQVFVPDGNNGETEVLGYDNMPMTGVLPVYTPNSTLHVVYLGATEDNNELYNGFKITIHQTTETMLFQDQVFYRNVGIGITPKTRLHVNGFVRGDGTNGALRIKTKTGITELGAQDYTNSHFKTDRSAFLFNKPVKVEGGKIQSSDASGNASALSLGYGDSTILSLTDTAIQLNAPLANNVKISDTLTVLGPIRGGQTCGSVRIKTTQGWVDIGSTHPGFTHFYTDRDKFYFNKSLSIDSGKISSFPRVDLQLQTFNTTHLLIQYGTGNVGIGTENPEYKLDVNGIASIDTLLSDEMSVNKISSQHNRVNIEVDTLIVKGTTIMEEVRIRRVDGADFVFDENYSLMSLMELQKYVQEHQHLPEIQSASDMCENGINISQFQVQLLQKIEEMLLYILQQEERIKQLEALIQKNE